MINHEIKDTFFANPPGIWCETTVATAAAFSIYINIKNTEM